MLHGADVKGWDGLGFFCGLSPDNQVAVLRKCLQTLTEVAFIAVNLLMGGIDHNIIYALEPTCEVVQKEEIYIIISWKISKSLRTDDI